jgi:hypothetical protein
MESTWIIALFFHHHAVAAINIFYPRHVTPHEHNAAPAGAVQVMLIGAIGDLAGVKPWSFVGDFQEQALGIKFARYMHVLVMVGAISVADGVNQGLLHSQVNSKDFVLAPLLLLKRAE